MLSLTLFALFALLHPFLPCKPLPQQDTPGKDYVVVNLGKLPYGDSPDVIAINNAGQIIGNMVHWGIDSSFTDGGFIWEAGGLSALPARSGRYVYASAINDRGDIVGQAHYVERLGFETIDTREERQPVVWGEVRSYPEAPPREMLYHIPMALSQKSGMALAINNKREIIAEEYVFDKNRPYDIKSVRYVLWRFLGASGQKRKRILLPSTWYKPLGITDAGEIIAPEPSADKRKPERWMRWKSGKQESLPLPADKKFRFNCMNNAGWLAGAWSDEKIKRSRPCLWKEGAIQELELLDGQTGEAMGANRAGEAVGYYIPKQGKLWEQRACLWHKGKPIDLNTWLPPNSGWILKEARAINDKGQIVGQGEYQGKPASFLLTPRSLASDPLFTPDEETPDKKPGS